MKTAKKRKYVADPNADPRLTKVQYIVFDCEQFDFWQQYRHVMTLEQDCKGFTFQYSDFGKKRPCWASLFFFTVNGIFTAFVDAHGAYFDHFKLEKYVFDLCGIKPNRNNHCSGRLNTHNHPAFRKLTREEKIDGLKKEIADLMIQLACHEDAKNRP